MDTVKDIVTVKPIFVRFGGAPKAVFQMNESELAQAAASVLRRAKEKAFYKGLPIYYSENNTIIAEYGDGRKEAVKKPDDATKSLRNSRPQRHR